MTLIRTDYAPESAEMNPVSDQNTYTTYSTPMTSEQVLSRLDELLDRAMRMQESTFAETETKLQITMLTEIIKEQHELLTAFLEDTKNTLITMNDQTRSIIKQRMDVQDSKLQWILDSNKNLLNLQQIYRGEVRDHTVEIIRDLNNDIFDSVNCNLDNVQDSVDKIYDTAKAKIDEAATICTTSVNAAKESVASLMRVSGIGTLLYILSPVAVIADIVLRIIQMNM